MMNAIADIRKDYKLRSFMETDAAPDPFAQFTNWWNDALASNIDEVNAMTLATADEYGKPSARIVLLKGMSEKGFEFYTNYESHKAKEMAANNKVALVFFWKELERQIRVEGTVTKATDAISDEYFLSRPLESRIGAWSSPQSSIITSRELLEANVEANKKKLENKEVNRPILWGGYIVTPTLFEFWQGRSSRLHDRIEYVPENGEWIKRRLAP
ncbi:MAG: pyridoxamine 5'-phosphate oxidase [Ferruginibacter sp.]|nr:pyridoxamine 5'-phosphate oxidase [Ferruginibacter sp.]